MSQNQSKEEASKYPDVIIEGHDYDGITEYDNPMPSWWLWIFYATIAWSIFYIAALGVGWIDDYDAQLERGQQHIAELRSTHADSAEVITVDADYLQGLLEDEQALSSGSDVYRIRCATCHGQDGVGGSGPAFNDGEWDHGDTVLDQYENIRDGIPPAGNMPAHDGILPPEDLASVAAFIHSLSP